MLVSVVALIADGDDIEVSVVVVVTVELSVLVVSLLPFPQPIEKAIKARTPKDIVIFFIINFL